jgi:hypothetical protein
MDNQLGKYLILIGAVILVLGIFIYLFGGLKWFGHLPGDIRIERNNFRFYFPITTLILINLVIFLIIRFLKWINF